MTAKAGDRLPSTSTAPATMAQNGAAPLLDAKGAAALINVPATWVLAEARAERIPHVRLGRYVRFDAGELHVWWLSRRRGLWRSGGSAAETARTGANAAPPAKQAA